MPKKRTAKKPSPKGGRSARASTEARTTYLSEDDLYLFNEGNHYRLHEKLGSRVHQNGGVYFAVWAPNASSVAVVGDFNQWNPTIHPLHARDRSGIWEGLVPEARKGSLYKYHIVSHHNGYEVDKSDPFAVHQETPPRTASVVWDLDYQWNDQTWMDTRRGRNSLDAPISIYEVHLGAWRRVPEDGNRSLSYREIAPRLAQYVKETGFTHVELMPITEHPFFGSWGYQTTGYFAPTSRYGTPQDFMHLVDVLHQNDIGVILDWVPSHFPNDEHGLGFFDGTHLFEHADPRQGFHQDWNSYIFNYGRNETRSFLISSALYWLNRYHVDGLRVDAVASMLYLDYSRKEGDWVPNEFGGNENIAAISFLRQLNEEVYRSFPDVQTIAEESTAWPLVSRPTYLGGLGFGLKWDMGWMHDTLSYMSKEPVHRKFHQDQLTFRMIYASNENFVLPLSHDEVVHGKGSLFGKMPGDRWQKFANLRLLYGYMFGQPGKKLLFMGDEFAQPGEWSHDSSLEWHLLDEAENAGLRLWLSDLNRAYRERPSLHQLDSDPSGFEWVDCRDWQHSIMSFLRWDRKRHPILAVYNFTPVPRHAYRVGVPHPGLWNELLNSDGKDYGGSGQGNFGGMEADAVPQHGRQYSLELTLPPLAAVFFEAS